MNTSPIEARWESGHEPGATEFRRYNEQSEDLFGGVPHRLDSDDARKELRQLENWYQQACDAEADNRLEQFIDQDYYDSLQIDEEHRRILEARGQAPLVYNKISLAVDWLLGTERRTRVDYKVNPRTAEDVTIAQIKTEIIKYEMDVNAGAWARSQAFGDQTKVGIGWTFQGANDDPDESPIIHQYAPWWEMRRDPFSRDLRLKDCRFLMREKYVDVDYAVEIAPDREAKVRAAAVDSMTPEDEYSSDDQNLPLVYHTLDRYGRSLTMRRSSFGGALTSGRSRVKIIEAWYRKPVSFKRFHSVNYPKLNGQPYDPNNETMSKAVGANLASLTSGRKDEMWCALFIPGTLLWWGKSPYKHGRFPYTPFWGKRRGRDGQPYGVVRNARDAQDDLNKRLSKAQFLLSTNQVITERGAIDADDEEEFRDAVADPAGVVWVNDGFFDKMEIVRNPELSEWQMRLAEFSATHINEAVGVNRDNQGMDSNAKSGRAILAKQQEGAVTTAELFDNYRLAIHESGSQLLSLTEQYVSGERQYRITGKEEALSFVTVNKPYYDEALGQFRYENDITSSQADFYVDQVDYRESMRIAMAESLSQIIAGLPPEAQLQLIDIPLSFMDMPERDEILRRVRAMAGIGPDGKPSPAVEAAKQQAQALADRAQAALIAKDETAAEKNRAQAQRERVGAKGDALNVGAQVAAAIPLAPVADRLLSDKGPDDPQAQPGAVPGPLPPPQPGETDVQPQ